LVALFAQGAHDFGRVLSGSCHYAISIPNSAFRWIARTRRSANWNPNRLNWDC